MMLKPVLLICFLSLTACSASDSTKLFTPMSVNDGEAAVYIYRPPVMANTLYSPDLYINEELKLSIKSGKNSRLSLPAGKYIFELDADNNQSQLTKLSLDLSPGNTYYIRVTTSLKIKSATSYEPYERNFNMESIDEEQALTQIAQCCETRGKKSTTESTLKSPDKEKDGGFSVDKTQNPFSH